VREVRPLADGDEIGLGVFMFLLVCTICGYVTPTILETRTPEPPRSTRSGSSPEKPATVPTGWMPFVATLRS
jgi:hypothetical protein